MADEFDDLVASLQGAPPSAGMDVDRWRAVLADPDRAPALVGEAAALLLALVDGRVEDVGLLVADDPERALLALLPLARALAAQVAELQGVAVRDLLQNLAYGSSRQH